MIRIILDQLKFVERSHKGEFSEVYELSLLCGALRNQMVTIATVIVHIAAIRDLPVSPVHI